MSSAKNQGPLITSKYRGGVDDFPREFLALIGIDVLWRHVPTDVDTDPISGLLIESKIEQERTNERKKTNTFFTEFPDDVLLSGVKLDSGLVGERTRRLVTDPTALVVDGLTESADQHNLGNGWLDQTIVEAPSLFKHRIYKRERGIVTPEDFRATVQTLGYTETEDGPASDPGSLPAGYISVTDEEVDVFHHRLDSQYFPLGSLPQTNHNYETNQFKQLVDIFRTLELDSVSPASPTALQDVQWTKLGDGTAIQVRKVIDEVFAHESFNRTRRSVTPEDFIALLQEVTTATTLEGTASEPDPLDLGELERSQEQLDLYTYRDTLREVDTLSLPQTIVNLGTNQFKQIQTITRLLRLDSATPATPNSIKDVTFTKLGDGTALEIRTTVDEVFDARTSSIEIPDLLPDIFKAVLPIFNEEFSEAGATIADPPTLGTGELFKSETRETEFTRKIRIRSRGNPELDTSILAKAALGGFEFGGGLINSYVKLVDAYEDPPEGLRYIGAQTVNLGDGLFSVSWDILDDMEWPELIGTEVDPRTGIAVGIKKKTVDAGTEGGVDGDGYHDVKPIDRWKSIMISSKLDPDSLPSPRTWETTIEHAFKNTLLGVEWVWTAASAPFAYDFDMTLVMDIEEGYAGPCRGKVTESFNVGAPADVVSPTIFCPKGHTVGFSWGYAADPSEDCGTCIGIARAHAQTWSIPPTLHDAITIGGAVTLDNGSFTSTLPATVPIGLPTPGTLITKACDVEVWRFNVFYRRLVEIYVPDCSA